MNIDTAEINIIISKCLNLIPKNKQNIERKIIPIKKFNNLLFI